MLGSAQPQVSKTDVRLRNVPTRRINQRLHMNAIKVTFWVTNGVRKGRDVVFNVVLCYVTEQQRPSAICDDAQ